MPRGRPKGSGSTPDKPRGRMTAYAFFVQTCRTEHKKLHPDENVQFAEFSRQCSERWKTMSEKEKKKFHDLADVDKARYDLEMKDFVPPPGSRRGRRGRGTRQPKDPNKPKRALSAFFYYANDERAKVRAANPDFSVGEVAKELGRQWNELFEGDKLKYEKQAEEDRARYDREMTVYKAGGPLPSKKLKATNGHPVDVKHEDNDDDDDDNDIGPDDDDDDISDDDE
ncbi:high mobility group protein DSP1-like [Homarus americanus]|uniref:High mobility group protein DSP1-like 2 n=1 Tax=Homarus americanus TaxID=6706 RepID=A0A8J5MV15_HOMAM|nr:high mobility group protein DSP1-like [Homarus americanus]KAG7164661.1 High mobility group protein DSP1-like 2 [Homarus americanus]